jgi:ribA/ribD-fused uncharacterized protein
MDDSRTGTKRKRAEDPPPIIHFWRPNEVNGWLCNWSPHPVREGGTSFTTVEHYYMYHKATSMGDAASGLLVLAAKTPWEAKKVGRGVASWNEAKWVGEREDVMFRGLNLKVLQHPGVKRALLQTCGKFLAEASPFDAVWGIGCAKTDPRALDPAHWPGKNLLGKLWMRVREAMLE